jgi:hypothetical protein
MVEELHLIEWPEILFGQQPLDSGLPAEECYDELRKTTEELQDQLPEEMPPNELSYMHETAPRLLPNQRAIVSAAVAIAKKKHSWVYIC